MFDAVKKFGTLGNSCCGIADQIVGTRNPSEVAIESKPGTDLKLPNNLNDSQCAAVEAAQHSRLLCLWGPPGTGKTQTIVAIIRMLQTTTESRLLVSAPTHNAVDNVMRRYLSQVGREGELGSSQLSPLRVSTEVKESMSLFHT
jgi:regulator of nonsense transcripts 1